MFVRWFACLSVLLSLTASQAVAASTEDQGPQFGKFLQSWQVHPAYSFQGQDAELKAVAFERDLLEPELKETEAHAVAHALWPRYESPDEAVDLVKATHAAGAAATYALTMVHCPGDTKAVLEIGSDDAIKVWINGELVHARWAKRSDEDLVSVRLRAGANHFLLKLVNAGGDWSFACRLLRDGDLTEKLLAAAVGRDEDRIKDLLAAGADINGRNSVGLTAFQAARIEGNERIARMLEVLGADPGSEIEPTAFIDNVMRQRITDGQPGIALLVSQGDEVLYANGFGMADIGNNIPVTTDTKFRIGSVTKQFTAAAILKLQEDGKLRVQDTLGKYMPDFPRADEVTLHHLLTHTSGLRNYTDKPDFYDTVTAGADAAKLIEQFKQDGFVSEPGEKFAYCNTGYFLLSVLVEQISGRPYAEYLRETFFEPLGMRDTGVHQATEIYRHEATGYAMQQGAVKKALNWNMSWAGGAGNIYSTVKDLHRWNQALFSGRVLQQASLTAAHQAYDAVGDAGISLPYGYGWIIDDFRGLKRVGHSGGLQGFVSQLSRYPEHDLTVVALHNALPSVAGLEPQTACDLMAKAFLWKAMKPRPKYEVAEHVDPASYDDFVGRYDYSGAVLAVTREGDRLMAQLTGQPTFEIFPSATDSFFWKVVDAQVTFLRNDEGQVIAARHAQGIAKFTAPRIEEIQVMELADAILDRYVGKYDYGSAGTLTIRRDQQQLYAQMVGQEEFPIFAKSATEFFWQAVHAELRFEVDEEGHVLKATHHQGGATIPVKQIK